MKTVNQALAAFLEDIGDRDFREWFESKLKDAKDALHSAKAMEKRGGHHRDALIEAITRYDVADFKMRVTNGEELDHWGCERRSAYGDIEDIIDDLDCVDIARHIIFSPAL